MNAIARDMGVDRRSVNRVVKMSERHVRKAVEAQTAVLPPDNKVPCPRCGRPKSRAADMCRDCWDAKAFAPTTLVKVPSATNVELRNVEAHRIVRVGDRWGVLLKPPTRNKYPTRMLVDFWDGGREYVDARIPVMVAPSSRVLVGGVEDDGEDIG